MPCQGLSFIFSCFVHYIYHTQLAFFPQLDGLNGEDPEDIGDIFTDENDLAEEDSDEDETESSIDLLVRFLQSMFKKLSKRAKKASRSVLPSLISPQLVIIFLY